ncbi:hypothetical protein PHYSODRAFT_252361 [Phytophthora sojae]|uniref:Band 7 domain-containing protein n=1 Tax=Phytophthora sojae (strain P6497) TaxID=1094619 RepID=G5A687_PHYSP|nr:hypothetical protein PHYSODRAFT_252361 [Phytophthora sojae]EGZ08842.1 hypothetical protein PHYSODRAFT_252361 [Phytophthora sojae]|eukprot:XP_009535475.1 hypothetical protein PHYSODRAFT_252361 [Phytophthora sojae]
MGCWSSKLDEPLPGQHQTRLLYRSTRRVDGVNRLYGACRHGNTVVIINPGRSPVKPYIRVPEGTYALVSQLVTKQYIVFDTPVKGCKTADDVTVGIDMCLILRIMGDESKGEDPELVRRFVYELEPNGLEIQLRAAQDAAVRALARSVEHTEVYQLRDGTMRERFKTGALNFRTNRLAIDEFNSPREDDETKEEGDEPKEKEKKVLYCVTEDIKRSLNEQFNTYGVQITSVAITNVTLPEEFQTQMQNRTTHLSAIKEQKMKQLSDMQMLQYKEELDTTKLKRKMVYMEEDQTGKAKCAEIRKGIDLINAQTQLADGEISQKTAVVCNHRDVEAALKIAEIEAETVRISTEINAHCDAEIQLINAEKAALQMKLDAITDEINATAEAKAAEIIARAEGAAAGKMEKYRKFKLEMKKLDVIGALAKNKKTVISGIQPTVCCRRCWWRIAKGM